ncbi:BRF1-domain-containing protein [Lentinula aff. lateritia]|uniref:BRF1-domain-containing protein n=1 Tax=Lentinula aff. lateritia TaxID=2804960 RepID=A0ACC1U5K2_9AGAR|nr:BRF1-domain-containing protein [Lentinula aff. lateritia]
MFICTDFSSVPQPTCTDCGGTVIEYDAAAGNGFCVRCGTVVEENTIVNEVAFGETSSGAAMVQGSYVAQGSSHARMNGPFGNRGSNESREQTIANATRKIQNIAGVLRLSEQVCLAATRLYTLAVEHKFTKGRKSMNVVAVCLYVSCRQKETRNYMLIDFSDILQVNVFELGHTYLQLVQTLNLRLPLVDPSHYISRFAALLEFGEETHRVATDAIRLVQRFDRDWMTRGRRPAGICGAALLLAARMNNFRRSVEEIVQVVKIADSTLKKRLDEFKNTPSGALTLADFRTVWLEDEMDPPAYTKGKEKEEAERLAAEQGVLEIEPMSKNKRQKKNKEKTRKRKRKRKGGEDDDEEATDEDIDAEGDLDGEPIAPAPPNLRQPIDLALMNEGILASLQNSEEPPLFLPELIMDQTPDPIIDPALLSQPVPSSSISNFPSVDSHWPPNSSSSIDPTPMAPPMDPFEVAVSSALAEEVSAFLDNNQGSLLSNALDDAEQQRLAQINSNVDDQLLGLDEDELNKFLLTDEEVKIKERVWVELNKDYLEALAAKGDQSSSKELKARKRRKTHNNKPRDTSTPHGATPAESVRNLIQKNPRYSKRINYDALKDLFVDSNVHSPGPDLGPAGVGEASMDLDDVGLYTLDDKDDKDDADLIVIEEDGILGVSPAHPREEYDGDGEAEAEVGGWEDVYEQEV